MSLTAGARRCGASLGDWSVCVPVLTCAKEELDDPVDRLTREFSLSVLSVAAVCSVDKVDGAFKVSLAIGGDVKYSTGVHWVYPEGMDPGWSGIYMYIPLLTLPAKIGQTVDTNAI